MAITETTRTGYVSRMGNSLKGIITGIILCLAAIVGLWWNEGDSIATAKSLEEGQEKTTPVEDITHIDGKLEGQLIHMSGQATTADVLTDPLFNVTTTGIALKRYVEYYQWVEYEKTETYTELGGAEVTHTTYTYEKEWKNKPVDSTAFKEAGHANYVAMQGIEAMNWRAKNVKFGAFRLNDNQIGRIGVPAPYSPKGLKIPELYENKAAVQGQTLYLSAITLPKQTITPPNLKQEQTPPTTTTPPPTATAPAATTPTTTAPTATTPTATAPTATTPTTTTPATNTPTTNTPTTIEKTVPHAQAKIGDMRITWKAVGPEQDVSLIAVQKGDTFATYVAKNGKTVNLIANGIKTMPEMYDSAHQDNMITTWLFRLLGWFVLFLGIRMILKPLDVLLSFLPFLEKIVGFATGLVAFIISLVLALLIIAVAWLFYRPLFSISLLVIVLGLFYLLKKRKKATQTENSAKA